MSKRGQEDKSSEGASPRSLRLQFNRHIRAKDDLNSPEVHQSHMAGQCISRKLLMQCQTRSEAVQL